MVVNLCLPHFHTTTHCNKLCADGYDVTNLVSADPAVRRRGFKLEYFLRPPVQVTLRFDFQVDLCRVDVELWPWGMDRGQACKRLEISTSSDPPPSTSHTQAQQKDQKQTQVTDKNEQTKEKHPKSDSKSKQTNGHLWSLEAQQWSAQAPGEPQQRGHMFKHQSNAAPSQSEPEFKLVARCELREETQVCFARSNFRPRAPFLSPLPPRPANCRQEDLWSRGLLSLGAVTQLRVTLPFGGAASSLGLKTLVVWGQPARCCPAERVERIQRVHEASERRPPRPGIYTPPVRQTTQPSQVPSTSHSIPEEFLDPITQEVMMLPMLLPSGVSVDNSTLEEHQKREATWGRPPNDPFTGVPFTSTSKPLPNPQLKNRIDHFLLQQGMMRREGTLGRQGHDENPQASRLIASKVHGQPDSSPSLNEEPGLSSDKGDPTSNTHHLSANNESELGRGKKRDLSDISGESNDVFPGEPLPQTKRQKKDAHSDPSSHEQRLSASLDEALLSALQGRPSFTSNLPRQRPGSGTLKTSQQSRGAGFSSMSTGEKICSACSCSLSVYSTSPVYRLTCGHLLCRSCLHRESKPPSSDIISASGSISCPTCKNLTPHGSVLRVHH
ncbi:RING finger protein 37 [Mugil cephalus]|uniref:RING finger protein 37 n=1 Tax=Mugil cephalus TaxID=48193 RepID=UPI001FB712F2|nr:RING finger protein 37 [Mugil cephalus]